MTRPYSVELRDRVVAFVESGHSRHQAAVHFQVSGSFVVKLMRAFRSSGRIEARPIGGRRHAKRDAHRVYPVRRMEEKDDITMSELAADLLAETGTQAAPASLSRWFLRNGHSVKKEAFWPANKIVWTFDKHVRNGSIAANQECGLTSIA
jgi:transposase